MKIRIGFLYWFYAVCSMHRRVITSQKMKKWKIKINGGTDYASKPMVSIGNLGSVKHFFLLQFLSGQM